MFVSIESAFVLQDNLGIKYNEQDTYIMVLSKFREDFFNEKCVPFFRKLGFTTNILYQDDAINDYIVHRGESERLRQVVIIFELDRVQS